MEMKQKEQEINKRKKRLLWEEKRMKETVLNAMNPVEREILEKELQKVHLKESTALNDIGKTVWDTKKIRELMDQDAELEEIKRFFDENQLKPDQYNRNAIPLAAYTYWYGRGCGREDVCLWALESATTIDGLLQVQEPSHLEKIAKKFISMDKYGVVAFRKMYLHEELCWTDAPNYLAAVMSGNVSLLQMFEAKDEEMTEENMEYWEYTCEWDRIPGAGKTYYSIRRETIVGDFYIPGILTAAILSGSPEMLDYCIDHYDIDGASLAYGEKEALGQAVAGAGKELTEYMLEHYTGLIELAEPDQVMKAGNVPLLRYLLETHFEHLNWYATLFFNLRDIRTPYMSAPGFPRDIDTDVEMYRAFLEWESPAFSMDFIIGQMRAELAKPAEREIDLKYYGEQEIQKPYHVNDLFARKMTYEWIKVPDCMERKVRLLEFYQELGGEITEELSEITGYLDYDYVILYRVANKQDGKQANSVESPWIIEQKAWFTKLGLDTKDKYIVNTFYGNVKLFLS